MNGRWYSWSDITARLRASASGTVIRIARHEIAHPLDSGMRPAFGLPVGQRSDYRAVNADCTGLHVHDAKRSNGTALRRSGQAAGRWIDPRVQNRTGMGQAAAATSRLVIRTPKMASQSLKR